MPFFFLFLTESHRSIFTDHTNQDKVKSVIEHIIRLQDYVTHIQSLFITAAEFAYLKTLILFSPGEWKERLTSCLENEINIDK